MHQSTRYRGISEIDLSFQIRDLTEPIRALLPKDFLRIGRLMIFTSKMMFTKLKLKMKMTSMKKFADTLHAANKTD